jgi:hypothetical protein
MKKSLVVLIFLLSAPLLWAQESQTEKGATDAISQAEKDVQEMQEMGFGVAYVNDVLVEAKGALKRGEYALAMEKAGEIGKRKQRAYAIRDSLRALELRIGEIDKRGLDTAEAAPLFGKASASFQNENYDESEKLIFQANGYLNDVEAEYSLLSARYDAARNNILSYLIRHRQEILITAAILLVIGLVSCNRIRVIRTRRKLKDMKLQKEVLADLIKKTQIDYFKKRVLLKETYDIRMKKYREMMLEIGETIPALQAKLGEKLD